MTDEQEHKRVRTVLDDVAEANDKRYAEWLKTREPGDTNPRIENDGKPLRIRVQLHDHLIDHAAEALLQGKNLDPDLRGVEFTYKRGSF